MIRFRFDEKKSAQAAALLLKLSGGAMPYMSLVKLLYFADREALLRTGCPITGDSHYSLPHGPVVSRILDLVRDEPDDQGSPWFEYVSPPANYSVTLRVKEPDTGDLSPFEIQLLHEIHARYKGKDQWDLRDISHRLPEWHDPEGSRLPISPEEILRAGGKTSEEVASIALDAEATITLVELLGGASGRGQG